MLSRATRQQSIFWAGCERREEKGEAEDSPSSFRQEVVYNNSLNLRLFKIDDSYEHLFAFALHLEE